MDLRSVLISTLLLMTAESNQTTLGSNSSQSPFPTQTNSPSVAPSATAGPTSKSGSSAILLGLITIKWIKQCEGYVDLILYPPSNSSPVCHSSERNIQSLFGNVCEIQGCCKDTLLWHKGEYTMDGYDITERGAKMRTGRCDILKIQCTAEVLPDVQGHLQAYKVVTALLCCILLVLLLVRFTRPTVKALQMRLSERRQNRWIGPTQSHSVSYNRGKTAVKNNDGEKRLSYPALERLAVSDSREPSSNRNSDYNF